MPKYAIIDVETTGGRAERERVTEIGIVIHDGERIVETWSSLINPEKSIPWEIERLTGISNALVAEAPRFFEVAKKVVELTEGAIFVAHNARFDYGFIRHEFDRLGYPYTRKMLDTVRLARQVFPGLGSYSLSNLKRHFGIHADRAHRALDDALATAQLFELILAKQEGRPAAALLIDQGVKEAKLPPGVSLEKLHSLPEAVGVYYLHDSSGDVVYVGKSINIKKRIFEHFAGIDEKGARLAAAVVDFSFKITGSELVALLLESEEIKRLQPRINRAQRTRQFSGAVFTFIDQKGYRQLAYGSSTNKNASRLELVADYSKPAAAKAALASAMRQFELCGRLTSLEPSENACFSRHMGRCRGACTGEESPEDYNERADAAIKQLANRLHGSYFLIENGRDPTEKAIVLVKNGRYQGFGFWDENLGQPMPEDLLECIEPKRHNPETARIILLHMEKKPLGLKLLRL